MSQENIVAIRSAYDAFGRGDIPAVLQSFDADIEWHVPSLYPTGGDYHGVEGVQQFFQALAESWEYLRVEPDEYLDSGDYVVALGHHRGRVKDGTADLEIPFAHVWKLRDGRPVLFREYADPSALLQAQAEQSTG
jgi:ketosteroid isomerase-like protein